MLILSKDKILVDAPIARHGQNVGACLYFMGMVRNAPEDNHVKGIMYSAYDQMCHQVYKDFIQQMTDSFPDIIVEIIHRIGFVPVGEVAVLVSVSSSHRNKTFQVLEIAVEWLKKELPIWKKIIHEDDASEWKANFENS